METNSLNIKRFIVLNDYIPEGIQSIVRYYNIESLSVEKKECCDPEYIKVLNLLAKLLESNLKLYQAKYNLENEFSEILFEIL